MSTDKDLINEFLSPDTKNKFLWRIVYEMIDVTHFVINVKIQIYGVEGIRLVKGM